MGTNKLANMGRVRCSGNSKRNIWVECELECSGEIGIGKDKMQWSKCDVI